jgi:cytochrome c oxidase subunit 3
MLFSALASAYVVRRGLSDDWVALKLPGVFYSTGVLLILASMSLEIARRSYRARKRDQFRVWWFGGVALAGLFAGTQLYGWKTVVPENMSVSSSPSVGFFFVLTGSFVLFVAGAVLQLIWVGVNTLRRNGVEGTSRQIELASYYWHYLDAVWLCLLVMFYLGS